MTPTPDNWRPAGASDHAGWEIVWAYALARVSLTAYRSPENIVAEQKAVWAVNEMLEKSSDGPCPVPPAKDSAVSTQTACETEGGSNGLSAAARRMPDSESVGSLAPVIAASRCENGVSPGPSETVRSLAAQALLSSMGLRYPTIERAALSNDTTWRDALNMVDVVSSAIAAAAPPKPVPSPDGAGEHGIQCSLCDETLHDNEICDDSECPIGGSFTVHQSPTGAAEPDAVREVLKDARDAIASLTENALGMGHDDEGQWPIRDELLSRIDVALRAPAVHDEQHSARFLASLVYHRGVAYGKGVESADAWVDANWRFFLGDARRLGGVAPAVGVTREALADAFAKKFPAVLAQYNQFKIVDWFLSRSPVPDATVSAEDDAAFEERLLKQDARYMLRLVDYIADKIGLPHNEELSQANFIAWFSAPQDVGREATIEACRTIALEQRCERNTAWDAACSTIADKIGAISNSGGKSQ